MKEIVVTTQAEFDALPKQFTDFTRIIIKNTSVRIVVEARGNSSVEARGNSSVEARGNSSVEAWENSSVEAWENSSVEAWGNSSVEAWENSSVVAWGNSSVVARGNSVIRAFSSLAKITLFGFAVIFTYPEISANIEIKSETCHIQKVKDVGWFEHNGVEKTPTLVLYKRVSHDFKTQENTARETVWAVGTTLIHPAWNPDSEECGAGKFHACSRPYFCDQFRSNKNDRYIALSVKLEDTHAWDKNPDYPYKIALREATVLYECNRFGKEITR